MKQLEQLARVKMKGKVSIADRWIGDDEPCFIVAEIGINHNGDLNLAKKLIDAASLAGVDAVKFQKRTPERCVPLEQQGLIRDTPWGRMTYLEYRMRVEFSSGDYERIAQYCEEKGILWFASCWDTESLNLIARLHPPCLKIASACLTDDDLLNQHRQIGLPILMSTGMSSLAQIDHAVDVLGTEDLILLHTTSTYPAAIQELNLNVIRTLQERYSVPVGYSGHEVGLSPSIAAVVMGACVLERHITLDRSMWGTDQAASVEPHGLARLVRDIRTIEAARGDGLKKVYESERDVMKKLRRIH